jgi:hypothetical protein
VLAAPPARAAGEPPPGKASPRCRADGAIPQRRAADGRPDRKLLPREIDVEGRPLVVHDVPEVRFDMAARPHLAFGDFRLRKEMLDHSRGRVALPEGRIAWLPGVAIRRPGVPRGLESFMKPQEIDSRHGGSIATGSSNLSTGLPGRIPTPRRVRPNPPVRRRSTRPGRTTRRGCAGPGVAPRSVRESGSWPVGDRGPAGGPGR